MTKRELGGLVWQRSSPSAVTINGKRTAFGATSEEASITVAQTETPTIASTWKTVAEAPITDELLEWPADLFALTNLILARSEAYRFALSPPIGVEWPPRRFPNWSDAVAEASGQWSAWLEDRERAFPDLLLEEWHVFSERIHLPLEHLAEGHDWRLCEALLTLHAIADEACAGLGIALSRFGGKGCLYRARGRELLARTGSLARIQSNALRVLPKVRTPPNGTSIRSFSRYACVQGPGVEARWHKTPIRRKGTDPYARHANLLLLPWPLRVRESDFHPVEGSVQRQTKEPFGFFEFAPSEKLDLDLLDRMIVAARDEVDSVDGVLLPESAVEASEVDDLEALLDRHGVGMLTTGVRQRSTQSDPPGNWVHTGVNPRLEKGGSPHACSGEQWFHIRQNKHHRWSLNEKQILQYHLGGALHPDIRWWEKMEVPRRAVDFVEHGDEIAIVSLVCEDLAQIDSVAEVIRSVGPTVVYAPLLDGPQISSRWSARYASVLADDPGSAVLTLTSYGMVQRSRPHGRDPAPVVALLKDPVRGLREIRLEPGAQGVLLTVCGSRTTRRSADGRLPIDNAIEYFDVAVHQVRASSTASDRSKSYAGTPAPRVFETDDLTILTGWAQAVLEALAYAPERIEPLIAEARHGAPWRTAFQIAEPSVQLAEAISSMELAIRAVMSLDGTSRIDALQVVCEEDRSGEDAVEKLVRRVLRSTLYQLRARETLEAR
jgi:hypothetical protein